jgi:hypothetical protein
MADPIVFPRKTPLPGPVVPQTDRETEALNTISTLLDSVAKAHAMIAQLVRTVMTLNARIEALEAGAGKPVSRIIVPRGHT